MAFDPKFPSAYYLFNTHEFLQNQTFQYILADDGTGCNSEETSALNQLLDARDEFYASHKDQPMMNLREVRMLSRQYREILLECQRAWKERLNLQHRINSNADNGVNTMDVSEDNATDILKRDEENLALFEGTLGIMHLSEIYLLGPNPNLDSLGIINTAGIVTADTVRYLRKNHMQSAVDSIRHLLPSSMSLDGFLSQPQPEHYAPNGRERDLTPFWILIRKLVLRGCLEEAWGILENHSAYRRCQLHSSGKMGASTTYSTIAEDSEAFHLIKLLLSVAPLAGGRNSLDDSNVSILKDLQDASIEILDQESDQDLNFNGVSSHASKLWDIDFDYKDELSYQPTFHSVSQIPIQFNIHSAYNMFKRWKESVTNLLKTNVPLKNLLNRIPSLKSSIWDMILGTGDFSFYPEDTWSEILAHELIYKQPYIKKEDVHIRWSAAIKRRVDDLRSVSILDISKMIMEDNASVALESLHTWGGKSGAALPAVLTSLLCDLLMMTNRIQPFLKDYDLRTELFLNASSSIISSFASLCHDDVGVHISTRLLLPYAGPDNIRVNAQLSEHLSHHYPKSDPQADRLISLCREWVDLGSRRLLDACELLALSRAQYHERACEMKKTALWLMKGIDLYRQTWNDAEKSTKETLPIVTSPSYSKLQCLCLQQSEKLLYSCVSKDSMDIVKEFLRRAQEVVLTIQTYDVNETIVSHPSFLLLSRLISLGANWMVQKYPDVAADIIYCLDDRLDQEGAVITLAHPLSLGRYLALAYVVLNIEDSASNQFKNMTASFDVYGIQILMMRYTQWQSLETYGYNVDDKKKREMSIISPNEMQEALAKGLMRAFVVENSKLRVEPPTLKAKTFSGAVTAEEIDYILEPSLFM